jgi:hypothetical protein
MIRILGVILPEAERMCVVWVISSSLSGSRGWCATGSVTGVAPVLEIVMGKLLLTDCWVGKT